MKEPANSPPWSARPPGTNPVRMFAGVFLAVFLIVFLGSATLTLLLPKSYCANARVHAPGTANLELFQSSEVLKEVSQKLDLPMLFANRYGENRSLEDKRVEELLRRLVQVRRLPGTGLVEIRAYSRSPAECAQFANAIAETAVRQSRQSPGSMRIVAEATPPLRPSRPNKPLNLTLGAVAGVILGTMAGGVGAKLAVRVEGQRSTGA